jgi:UDP-glucuronate decarboxylase
MTVHELAVKVKGVINDDIKIVFKDLPSDDPRRRQPDITKVFLQAEVGEPTR